MTQDGDNWMNNPSRLACGACHDNVNFATGDNHPAPGGVRTDDSQCKLCHTPDAIALAHATNDPTPHNPLIATGAHSFKYVISGATVNASGFVEVTFQIFRDFTVALDNSTSGGTPVDISADGTTLDGGTFTGGPAFLVAYGTAQDGVASPTDWNSKHDSVALTAMAQGTNGNILTLVDAATNTYKATIVSTTGGSAHTMKIPAGATMVTAVLDGTVKTGTTTWNALADMKTADGYTERRQIISMNSKCDSCHERSQAMAHGSTYNQDKGMCAVCHTPNQGGSTTRPWSASFRVWVHGIHAANEGIRSAPFTWHGADEEENFFTEMNFPGIINNCENCHISGTYDFSAPQYTDTLINNMLDVTDATGTLSTNATPASGSTRTMARLPMTTTALTDFAYGLLPGTNYGTAPAIDTSTTIGVWTNVTGAGTDDDNLVSSPITAVCSSCHDAVSSTNHMKSMGGKFYDPRGPMHVNTESCLTCHGPGKEWAIKTVHGL